MPPAGSSSLRAPATIASVVLTWSVVDTAFRTAQRAAGHFSWALDHAQSVLVRSQVSDHLRIEQAHEIAGGPVAETGIELLRPNPRCEEAEPLQCGDIERIGAPYAP